MRVVIVEHFRSDNLLLVILFLNRSALAEVTNELEERQQRWSQIESLCGFQIMSQTSFGVGKDNGTRSRSGSAIAQALVNVANVAGVSSGRKISFSASPWKTILEDNTAMESKEDLPPTYSTATAKVGLPDDENKPSTPKKNSAGPEFDDFHSSCQDILPETEDVSFNMSDSHPSHQLGAEAMNGATNLVESKTSGKHPEHLVLSSGQLEEDDPAVNGTHSESPTGKSKKRLSWFGKRQDSTTESESSSAPENDDETKRKVRWLWRSAVRKSKAQRNPANKREDDAPVATSLEKLKSG